MSKIEFTASLPPIQSAINLDGNGDGARVKLDISRQDIPAVIKLQELSGQCFKVTIEEIEDKYYEGVKVFKPGIE